MFLGLYSSASIKNCSFTRGVGSTGAALFLDSFSKLYMANSLVERNTGVYGSIRSSLALSF